jgi:hypothetical protein
MGMRGMRADVEDDKLFFEEITSCFQVCVLLF